MPQVFFLLTSHDLEKLGYNGPMFWLDPESTEGIVILNSPTGLVQLELETADSEAVARKRIGTEVKRMLQGGTLLVVEPKLNRDDPENPKYFSHNGRNLRYMPSDTHFILFDSGPEFNAAKRRTNSWCPSSSDSDWNLLRNPSRFERDLQV